MIRNSTEDIPRMQISIYTVLSDCLFADDGALLASSKTGMESC